jgi:hypothetical protein
MLKNDSNTNKIIPWKIDKSNSKVELEQGVFNFKIRFIFETIFLQKLNNIKIDILSFLRTQKDTRLAEKLKAENRILRLLQAQTYSKDNFNNQNIIFTKIINVSDINKKNYKNTQQLKQITNVENFGSNIDSYKNYSGTKPVKNSHKTTFKSGEYIYDLNFSIDKDILQNTSDIFFHISEHLFSLNEKIVNKFSKTLINYNLFENQLENKFVFTKPIVKHSINKTNGQSTFEITNRDKNAKYFNVYAKELNKFENDSESNFELISTDLILYNQTIILNQPYKNQETIYRFTLSNDLGFDSEYEEIILRDNNENNSFVLFTSLYDDKIRLNISNIDKSIFSFLVTRLQIFPRGNQEYKFIISKDFKETEAVFDDDFNLINGFIYEYKVQSINTSGALISYCKTIIQEYEKISPKNLTSTKLNNNINEVVKLDNNKKILRTNIDVNINSKNIKNVSTDLQFNNINNVNISGNVITGSAGLFSKTDVFDQRIKNVLLEDEYSNDFGYEVSILNKKTGRILDLGKNFGNNFDREIDLSSLGLDRSGVYEYQIKTKTRHKSIYDSGGKYKFFHPYVKKFGTLVTKETNDLKIAKDDFLIGELHEINSFSVTDEEENQTIKDQKVFIVNNFFVFRWLLDKPNINIESFELLLESQSIAKVFAPKDKIDFYFVRKISEYDFGEFEFNLKSIDKKGNINILNFNKVTV